VDPTITRLILGDRKIAYAITDRDLKVVEVGGAVDILLDDRRTCLGHLLPDLVPELIGCEAVLADILAGALPRFELGWDYRETAEGQALYLTIVELPYRGQTGHISGVIHLVQDVTDMAMVARQLAQNRNELRLLRDQLARQNLALAAANAELRRLDEMKSVFVSVAAHELRTPLTPVKGYIEVLLDGDVGPVNDDQCEYLRIVQGSVERLLKTTNNLLDVTRIEAGRVELVLQPTDLAALVETVATEYISQLEASAQRLTLHAPPDLPPALCDEARTVQIIGNLLSNASKYTPQGGLITVSLGLAAAEGFLQLSVMDDGVGIPAEDQPKLFDRFFRAKSALLTGVGGAGLGLHITRSLVELHGGRIWFESAPGEGSTFHVTFPTTEQSA
jgi:signal transduction histidine kinase